MQYLGGKVRIAKQIAKVIRENNPGAHFIYEPFMGGANVTTELAKLFPMVLASDSHPDVIALWRAVQQGWLPPENITREEYALLKQEPSPSALRGYVGFGYSFAGKFFAGFMTEKPGGPKRQGVAARAIAKQAPFLANVEILCADYASLPIVPGTVIYADPPYAATTGYSTGNFDTLGFWETCRKWRDQGAKVYVSEYQAPSDWAALWSKSYIRSMQGSDGKVTATDFLFH